METSLDVLELAMDSLWDNEAFSKYIHRTREELIQQRTASRLWLGLRGYGILPGGGEIWYGDMPDAPYYVKLIGEPGTLASDILRLKVELPRYNCDLQVIGNDVHEAERKPFVDPDEEVDPDLEDCSEELAKLPLIVFDPDKHFTKAPTYKQEIRYLLQCQGSKHVVQLLGRTEDGLLVFPKIKSSFLYTVLSNSDQSRIQNIKRWMLDIIDGVAYLHSLGIVHRDLTMRNILDSGSAPLIICDLQCLHSTFNCRPFEIDDGDYSKFSFASDVFALGSLLWECCFYNNPTSRHVMLGNPPPPPFRDIFMACTREKPEDRPTLAELKVMYEAIDLAD
ncbi:kinase-like domain-containing protein [Pholiota molesta]|nr:kinase-like domain-containing protein [Pholiota molesta]